MKKLILTIIFAFTIMVSQFTAPSEAEAYDYFIGVYPATGLNAYLMTQTVYRYGNGYKCTIVCYPRRGPYYIDYTFWIDNGRMYYSNSDGYSGKIRSSYADPVEYSAYTAIMNGTY